LRLLHGVAEAMELNHENELESHHRLVHGLQQARGGAACWFRESVLLPLPLPPPLLRLLCRVEESSLAAAASLAPTRVPHAMPTPALQDLAAERQRVQQLEREVAALRGAAAGAGVDVAAILRLAAATESQPEDKLKRDAADNRTAGRLNPASPDDASRLDV
jgi:hypothetical protein